MATKATQATTIPAMAPLLREWPPLDVAVLVAVLADEVDVVVEPELEPVLPSAGIDCPGTSMYG